MRVLDASVVVDALVVAGPAGDDARRVLAAETWLHVPALLGAEVVSALRAMVRREVLTAGAARVAVARAGSIRARRYAVEPLAPRVWELRDSVRTYDAWYVALAERLGAPLVTGDGRLRRAEGPRCAVLSPQEALAGA